MSSAPYIELVSCCDSSIILYFKLPDSFTVDSPSYQYTGAAENGLVPNACYTITQKLGTIGYVVGLPTVNAIYLTNRTGCEDAKCACSTPCYTLYACDGSYFNTTTDLSANVGTYIRIEDSDKTWYVVGDDTKTTCNNALDVILDTVSPKTECVLTCYQVTGTPASVTYMDANYNIITTFGATKVCSYITPIVTGPTTGFVVELGDCVDGECPEICFKFTNCQTSEVLVVSNAPSIIPYYAQDQIVTLQGYDGCWTIDISEICTCPVSVTILKAYASCIACLPIVNYKFTNCDNQSIIKYSTEDYSAYVGKTVELECGECWFVDQIDYVPPATQPIVILYTFDSCLACNRTYYKLTDCLDPNNVTYTYTDLSFIIPPPISCNDCINVSFTYDGLDYNFNVPKVGELNGKNRYLLIFNEEGYEIMSIIIYWNNIDNSWFLLINTLDYGGLTYSSNIDNECPFFTNWIFQGDDEILTDVVTTECTVLLPVIKIKGCDTCFTVEETREPVNAGIVEVTNNYIDCPECLETFPCNCTQVSNTTTETQTYCYLDCDFNEQSIILEPGETSDKICVIDWITCKSGNCNCLEGFISTDDFQTISKFDKTDVIKNGKPVYTSLVGEFNTLEISFSLSYESDNCWYVFSSGDNVIPLPVLKLCNNSNCPTGEWEQVIDCIRFDAQITIDGVPNVGNWFVTNVDNNGYYTYVTTSDNQILYSIKYNSTLNRWELFNNVNILIAYYNTENSCPITDKPEAWTSLNENTSFLILNDVPAEPTQLTVAECQTGCNCIFYELTIPDGGNTTVYGVLENTGTIINNKPVYISTAAGGILIEIFWDNITNCWIVSEIGSDDLKGTLCNSSSDVCPIGTWEMDAVDELFSTEYCTTDSENTIENGSYPPYIKNFGACTNGICPTVPLPKRFIRPGYSVPACDVEKYEKFACKSSEILYKQVLEKRYGITNCCPEGEYDQRWIIKKELADLQGFRDSNYNCTPVNTCCNKAPSCNCH